MLKKTLLAMLILGSSFSSFSSFANWVGGISYINLSDEEDDLAISLNGITGSLGYKIDSENSFYFIPEVRIGTEISNDSVTVFGVDVDVEMDSFIAFSVRGQYELDNGVYLFAAPSYTNIQFTASTSLRGQNFSVTDDSWEFGFGGGVGYKFNESISAEFMYEQYDGADLVSFGVKFDF